MTMIKWNWRRKDVFHARPAAIIATAAKAYKSVILLIAGSQVADAKNVIALMQLGALSDSELELMVDGDDEEEALQEMIGALEACFGTLLPVDGSLESPLQK